VALPRETPARRQRHGAAPADSTRPRPERLPPHRTPPSALPRPPPQHPEASHRLLGALAEALADLLVGEWRAGASALQVFESSAGELSPADWREYSLPYLRRIAELVRARVPSVADGGPPLVVFARCAHHAFEALSETFDVVGVDWAVEPAEAVARVGDKCLALQGNLDPGRLYGDDDSIRAATRAMLEGFGDKPLIANLGWGMHPTHEPRALKAYFTAVHEESAALRAAKESV